MTRDELRTYNGQNNTKAYVAYKGVVYDVTSSSFWEDGDHQGMHSAGQDLTEALSGAPHGDEVFKRFPIVGNLDEEKPLEASQTKPQSDAFQTSQAQPHKDFKAHLRTLYKKYHPHPITVHFPIALHIFAAGLDVLFLLTPKVSYATGVFYTFFIATVMGFIAMMAGMLSWWINYHSSMHKIFVIKITVSLVTLFLGLIGIGIYLEMPQAVYDDSLPGIIYHGIVLVTGLNVIVLGYYGGKISWGNLQEEKRDPDFFVLNQQEIKAKSATPNKGANVDITILIGGAAGAGIESLEKILSYAFRASGFYLFSTKEFMSRVRGGSNTVLIRISDIPVQAPCWEVDISLAIDKPALEHMQERWTKNTLVFADETFSGGNSQAISIAMNESAKKFGNMKYANTYAAGLLFGVLKIDMNPLLEGIQKYFKDAQANIDIAREAYETGSKIENLPLPSLPKADQNSVKNLHLMDGTTACGFGFLAGGCNMMTSYPMSPSTGVLNFMASMSKELDIAVEQSEDEIASLHMVLGGWYAGARAMTTTSGGGFALMGEALSLSGMTETPAVIYLAQRPGPATGLPTRSEQGDLNMALYSGHGPFPRIVLAPGSLQECIDYGYLAFELADKYQTPVIFLSDQYLADSISMIEDIDFSSYGQHRYVVKSSKEYRRYEDTKNGISPRTIPDFGEGLLCAVGDEHDERGQITEDHKTRMQMVGKRARKNDQITKEAIPPVLNGEGDIAIIGWGSTKGIIAEALHRLPQERLVQVHFAWLHPLGEEQLQSLEKFQYKIVVENNADGAFANQLILKNIKIDKQILQCNGFNFFADQLAVSISSVLKELS